MQQGRRPCVRRRLPAEQVVWLVIGMALVRDRSIADVVRQLDLALPTDDGRTTVASSAVAQARARLGSEPLEWLSNDRRAYLVRTSNAVSAGQDQARRKSVPRRAERQAART
jgi:hypothetical protein